MDLAAPGDRGYFCNTVRAVMTLAVLASGLAICWPWFLKYLCRRCQRRLGYWPAKLICWLEFESVMFGSLELGIRAGNGRSNAHGSNPASTIIITKRQKFVTFTAFLFLWELVYRRVDGYT